MLHMFLTQETELQSANAWTQRLFCTCAFLRRFLTVMLLNHNQTLLTILTTLTSLSPERPYKLAPPAGYEMPLSLTLLTLDVSVLKLLSSVLDEMCRPWFEVHILAPRTYEHFSQVSWSFSLYFVPFSIFQPALLEGGGS